VKLHDGSLPSAIQGLQKARDSLRGTELSIAYFPERFKAHLTILNSRSFGDYKTTAVTEGTEGADIDATEPGGWELEIETSSSRSLIRGSTIIILI
jgi:hypothetical protein